MPEHRVEADEQIAHKRDKSDLLRSTRSRQPTVEVSNDGVC